MFLHHYLLQLYFHTIYIATIKLSRISISSLDKHVVYEAKFLPIKQIASYPRQPPPCLVYT